MKVISVNIGQSTTVQWRGKNVQTGIYKYPVPTPIFLGETDVTNDHVVDRIYHGGRDKACYLYSSDCYDYWKIKYPDLDWKNGMFGENITIEGMNDSQLNIGDIFQLGEAKIQISQARQPCFKLGIRFNSQKIIKDFINSPFPGAYVKVLEQGEVKAGDEMKFIERKSEHTSLTKIFELMYQDIQDGSQQIEELLKMDFIADECKMVLRKRL